VSFEAEYWLGNKNMPMINDHIWKMVAMFHQVEQNRSVSAVSRGLQNVVDLFECGK
jgi:hypothetical protein